MTRWRSRLQNLILRQYPLLFAEPEALQPADTVINNIYPVKQTYIHHSVYSPLTQGRKDPGTVSRIVLVTQGSREAAGSNPSSYPGQYNSVRNGVHSAAGRLTSIQVLQERVRKQQSNKHPVTTIYRTENIAKSTVEPVSPQRAERDQARTEAPPRGSIICRWRQWLQREVIWQCGLQETGSRLIPELHGSVNPLRSRLHRKSVTSFSCCGPIACTKRPLMDFRISP